jgi:hypothetical protein
MITTNIEERYPLLQNAIASVERCDKGVLDQKVLSVDIMKGSSYNSSDFQQFVDSGWLLVEGDCSGYSGMANNISRGLSRIDGDLLFYCEDDIVVNRIPSRENLERLFSGSNPLGFIVYNTHACAPWITEGLQPKLDYINDKVNYLQRGDDLFLIKGESIRDEYWICFPVAIMETDNYRSCLAHAKMSCGKMGMEPGMTKAWLALGFDKYPAAVYVQKNIFDSFPLNFQKLHDNANMRFWNNDVTLRHSSINDRKNTLF